MYYPFPKIRPAVLACALLTSGIVIQAPAQEAATPKPDNTKTNKQDRVEGAATADQQKENKSDRALAQQIRKAVIADKSLSTYAHNVKIVAQNGIVTLKGPVRSEAEKNTIEQKAVEVAGANNVKNEITIVSADTSKPAKK
jgi:osmotically-inducible protein OsmY